MLEIERMAVVRHALTLKSKGQRSSHVVIRYAVGRSMQVDRPA